MEQPFPEPAWAREDLEDKGYSVQRFRTHTYFFVSKLKIEKEKLAELSQEVFKINSNYLEKNTAEYEASYFMKLPTDSKTKKVDELIKLVEQQSFSKEFQELFSQTFSTTTKI